jgi:hypothetical protein
LNQNIWELALLLPQNTTTTRKLIEELRGECMKGAFMAAQWLHDG